MKDHRRTGIDIGERSYLCDVCNKSYRSKKELKLHIMKHTGDFPHKCVYCDKGFTRKRDMLYHLTKHTNERNQICDVCGKCFARKDMLYNHKKIVHSMEKPYTCKCGKSYKRKNDLKKHKRLKLGMCEKSRELSSVGPDSNLIPENLNKNRNNRDYISAEQVGTSNVTKKTNDIARKCQGAKMNESNVCLEENVKQSKAKRVALIDDTDMICQFCNKTFTYQKSYLTHLVRQHEDKTEYKCYPCFKVFRTLDSLIRHQKNIHYVKKDHPCDIYDKNFKSKTTIEDHRRIHTSELPYLCKICDKSFSCTKNLKEHIKSHTDDFPHKCDYCGKGFKSKQDMLHHSTKHTSERKQIDDTDRICKLCNKNFFREKVIVIMNAITKMRQRTSAVSVLRNSVRFVIWFVIEGTSTTLRSILATYVTKVLRKSPLWKIIGVSIPVNGRTCVILVTKHSHPKRDYIITLRFI
ncbi:zinc finger protein 271-like [Nylanderia fulva]|uniref:zinc finger protein 271-like n=1 Tax=Nylanderia fulva TaxID=613905 RepID=UPI0010FBB874|nr:zinc finger protein 271-like [Nylanderia fulva]